MRIKKNFTLEDLKEYMKNGCKLYDNNALTTYGTGGRGYYHRQGYTLVTPDNQEVHFQIIFTSAGYGNMTQQTTHYNGRILEKHFQYRQQVCNWLNNTLLNNVTVHAR